MTRQPGRPATFTPELGAELQRRHADGQSVRRAAGETGVSPRTASRWLDQGPVVRPSEEPIALPLELTERLNPQVWRLPQLRQEQQPRPKTTTRVWAEIDEVAERRRAKHFGRPRS